MCLERGGGWRGDLTRQLKPEASRTTQPPIMSTPDMQCTSHLSPAKSDSDDFVCEALMDRNDLREHLCQTSSSVTTQSWSQMTNQSWRGHWQYHGWGHNPGLLHPKNTTIGGGNLGSREMRHESKQCGNVQETRTMSKYRRNPSQYEVFVF